MGTYRSPYLRQRNFSEALTLDRLSSGLRQTDSQTVNVLSRVCWIGLVLGPVITPAQTASLVQSMSTLLDFTYP